MGPLAALLVLGGCAVYPPPDGTVVAPAPAGTVWVDATVVQPAPIIVHTPPPPPRYEWVPPPPFVGAIWIAGFWEWRNGWVWVPGRWVRPPGHDHRWMPPRYEQRDGRLIFVPGFWVPPGHRAGPGYGAPPPYDDRDNRWERQREEERRRHESPPGQRPPPPPLPPAPRPPDAKKDPLDHPHGKPPKDKDGRRDNRAPGTPGPWWENTEPAAPARRGPDPSDRLP
ncbi:hypothetical protein [Tibeticola sp.]|uniref:hypothetical protein n=1 Tax=Tibeticola sp. TaxID=2005368 RepID=UPI0025865709|nr:hypothetical protein [Tibeticola sp.]MCI4441194.1 hypothetical protein [Tibeticola sp.]